MKKGKTKSPAIQFQSTHNLTFESVPWERSNDWFRFRIGTCHGLWRSTFFTYDILAIDNDEPGNGHFEDVLEWFENSCRRDKMALCIMHVWNRELLRHLITRRGFFQKGDHCFKIFK